MVCVHGVNHTNTGGCVSQLGTALLNQNKLDDETRAVFQRSLAIHLLNWGPDTHNVGNDYSRLGFFHAKKGEYVKAKRLYKEALRIYTKVNGPDYPVTVKAKEDLLRVS